MNTGSKAVTMGNQIDVLGISELMKPELTGLSVLTSICAFYLASDMLVDWNRLLYTAIGTLFVGGAAGALNQYLERDLDGLMKRTERRPLPSGRLSPALALFVGVALSFIGLFVLLTTANVLAFGVALVTLTSYLFIYTPMKRTTPLNTVVGAIPGALPVLIGWSAARNDITVPGILLFAVLFAWQVPHFLSLAWMYRKDYGRAGFKMLPVIDDSGLRTGRGMLWYTGALVLVSLGLTFTGTTGYIYLSGAIIAGTFLLYPAYLFRKASLLQSQEAGAVRNSLSRKIFFASLAYLPALMTLMVLDKS